MSALDLASAQIEKAQVIARAERRRQQTDAHLQRLKMMVVSGAEGEVVEATKRDLVEAFTAQVESIVEAAAVERRIKEASR
jgi:ferritin-like metal-binding protein YciE